MHSSPVSPRWKTFRLVVWPVLSNIIVHFAIAFPRCAETLCTWNAGGLRLGGLKVGSGVIVA